MKLYKFAVGLLLLVLPFWFYAGYLELLKDYENTNNLKLLVAVSYLCISYATLTWYDSINTNVRKRDSKGRFIKQ